jgi:hypothetical protein
MRYRFPGNLSLFWPTKWRIWFGRWRRKNVPEEEMKRVERLESVYSKYEFDPSPEGYIIRKLSRELILLYNEKKGEGE